MTKGSQDPSLRILVGIVSVGIAQLLVGEDPADQTIVMFNEELHTIGRGTPGTALTGSFEATPTKAGLTFRKFFFAELPADINTSDATIQLCGLSGPHATSQSIKLALAIAKCIEDQQLLPGFSATVAAATSLRIAGISLAIRPMLAPYMLEKLRIVPGCVRIAYNRAWIQRGKLDEVIWSSGGDPALLPSPKMANGEVDAVLFAKGTGLLEHAVKDRTRPAFQAKGSLLRFVTYPGESEQTILQASANGGVAEADEDDGRRSHDSWESWSSKDDEEWFAQFEQAFLQDER